MESQELRRRLLTLVERVLATGEAEAHELEHHLHSLREDVHDLLCHLRHPRRSPPAAPTLAGFFHLAGDFMSNANLTATLPITRQDATPLAATDIASITFQKTSLVGSPPAPGPLQVLQTNSAVAGAGLLPADLSVTDTAAVVGDVYSCFVTDTLGHIGAASNTETVPASASPPSAPSLTATFT